MAGIVVIDAGHGTGNRQPGRYDPGAVRLVNGAVAAEEAHIALEYAIALDCALRDLRFETLLTRNSQKVSVSLKDRLKLARAARAALLVSLHCNADADPDAAGNPQASGHEVIYSTTRSGYFADAITTALRPLLPPHGDGVIYRRGLYLLRHDPSVLIEIGFIDSADYQLISDQAWKLRFAGAIAGAIAAVLSDQPWNVEQKGASA